MKSPGTCLLVFNTSFLACKWQGNADAVRRFLWMLEECPATEFLILPGYHLYRMDYQEILQLHHETRADITISAIRSEERHDKGFGILKVNSDNKVIGLFEKDNTAFPLVSCWTIISSFRS